MKISSRNSNIELLRILSIICIVLSHCVYHGGSLESSNEIIKYFSASLAPLGKLFFCVFAVISCWFLIDAKFSTKRFAILWVQVLLFNLTLLCIELFVFDHSVTKTHILKSFFPMLGFGVSHGYIAGFLLFYLCFPFIQAMLRRISVKAGLYIFIILFLLNMFMVVNDVTNLMTELLFFISIFILTSVIKKSKFVGNTKKYKLAYLLIVFICLLGGIGSWMLKVRDNSIGKLAVKVLYEDERCIINIIFGFSLFLFVNSFKTRVIPIVNALSKCTLDVLLLHDSGIIRNTIWHNIFKSYKYIDGNKFFIWLLLVPCIIFVSGLIIYYIRMILVDRLLLSKGFVKDLYTCVDTFYEKNISNLQCDYEIKHEIDSNKENENTDNDIENGDKL